MGVGPPLRWRDSTTKQRERIRPMRVREATFDVMRQLGLRTVFGNPGSIEIPFLTDLPEDLRFVLALHENSVVGMACGHAIATSAPALVNLHTIPGLGNAVNALANARECRVPLVVLVGQQARRHLADVRGSRWRRSPARWAVRRSASPPTERSSGGCPRCWPAPPRGRIRCCWRWWWRPTGSRARRGADGRPGARRGP